MQPVVLQKTAFSLVKSSFALGLPGWLIIVPMPKMAQYTEKWLLIQSCKNVRTVRTSRCYFFWPVLIFGKSTRKTGENTQKHAKTGENTRKQAKTGEKQALFWC